MVKVLGVNKSVSNVTVNGTLYSQFLYNTFDNVCTKHLLFDDKVQHDFSRDTGPFDLRP